MSIIKRANIVFFRKLFFKQHIYKYYTNDSSKEMQYGTKYTFLKFCFALNFDFLLLGKSQFQISGFYYFKI